MRVNFVAVWVGERYSADYVEILRDAVLRNCSTMEHPCAWYCVTDRADELPEGVYPIPAKPGLPGYWQKVALFSPDMPWAEGDRIVYFDLDVCITGRLEDLVERKGIARDAGWPCANSSVMVWDHGEHRDAWDRFTPEVMTRSPGPLVPAWILPAGVPNGGDQEWFTEVGGWDLLPSPWVLSYRWQAKDWPPAGSKVVQFHGATKPADVTKGWVPNVWKVGGFTSLPEMRGANVTPDAILANIRANVVRDLPWFTGRPIHDEEAVLVCGGPSMKTRVADIKRRVKAGAKLFTVNNALRFCREHGLTPEAHVMLDARPENAAFVTDAPEGVRYFLASQCHPDVFDALSQRDVIVWHNLFGSGEEIREILEPWWDGENAKPIVGVPGGGTVGLRSLNLLWLSGYRKIHVYGLDSSYADDAHHAYPQALNDDDRTITVTMGGKTYRCALWMSRQAEEFRLAYDHLQSEGVQLWVHGAGLIPDMWKSLRATKEAA